MWGSVVRRSGRLRPESGMGRPHWRESATRLLVRLPTARELESASEIRPRRSRPDLDSGWHFRPGSGSELGEGLGSEIAGCSAISHRYPRPGPLGIAVADPVSAGRSFDPFDRFCLFGRFCPFGPSVETEKAKGKARELARVFVPAFSSALRFSS